MALTLALTFSLDYFALAEIALDVTDLRLIQTSFHLLQLFCHDFVWKIRLLLLLVLRLARACCSRDDLGF